MVSRALGLAVLALSVAASAGPVVLKPVKTSAADRLKFVVSQVVRQYVRDQVDEEGSFTLEDDVLGRAWDAKLMGLRRDSLRRHANGTVSMCADFTGESGKNTQSLDVDFVLVDADGEWVVDEVHIHRVGSVDRFKYGPKNERITLKAGKKRRPVPAGEPGE